MGNLLTFFPSFQFGINSIFALFSINFRACCICLPWLASCPPLPCCLALVSHNTTMMLLLALLALFSLFLTPLLLPLSPQVPRSPQRSLWTQCWQMCGPCRAVCPASVTTCTSCLWDLPRLLDLLLPRYSLLCFVYFVPFTAAIKSIL